MTSDEFLDIYHRARDEGNAQLIIDALPYATFLGMRALEQDGELIFHLPPLESNIGNPTLPALHGGAVGGFMEMAAVTFLLMSIDHDKLPGGEPRVPKLVDISVDYIRACRYVDTWAACEVVRQGRKLANVAVKVWQQDRNTPTTTARSHYLLG
ncbi:PaaI family thioesterase [Proteobacteria bacterium 005FR1]|nr:PaaI family thioesterase [Proteobacteria bacterium 005FR1]